MLWSWLQIAPSLKKMLAVEASGTRRLRCPAFFRRRIADRRLTLAWIRHRAEVRTSRLAHASILPDVRFASALTQSSADPSGRKVACGYVVTLEPWTRL
jgi:hypothetical protein